MLGNNATQYQAVEVWITFKHMCACLQYDDFCFFFSFACFVRPISIVEMQLTALKLMKCEILIQCLIATIK